MNKQYIFYFICLHRPSSLDFFFFLFCVLICSNFSCFFILEFSLIIRVLFFIVIYNFFFLNLLTILHSHLSLSLSPPLSFIFHLLLISLPRKPFFLSSSISIPNHPHLPPPPLFLVSLASYYLLFSVSPLPSSLITLIFFSLPLFFLPSRPFPLYLYHS